MIYSFRGLNHGHRRVEFGSQERALAFADILSEAWRCGVVVKTGHRLIAVIYRSESGIPAIFPGNDSPFPINVPSM